MQLEADTRGGTARCHIDADGHGEMAFISCRQHIRAPWHHVLQAEFPKQGTRLVTFEWSESDAHWRLMA